MYTLYLGNMKTIKRALDPHNIKLSALRCQQPPTHLRSASDFSER
jgi:hypothetical protein